ncbi:MAG: LysM peptidoglycan-binding domain-containing protein [Ruminococcaceae bacterium]|nr:LysM peptidoglycan-binding domain-containing protein [Oscillospiraceae bacterium]
MTFEKIMKASDNGTHISEKTFTSYIFTSCALIFVLVLWMPLSAFAYFYSEKTSVSNTISTATYDLGIYVTTGAARESVVLDENNTFTLTAGKQYTVVLEYLPDVNTAETGFAIVKIGEDVLYTQQIGYDAYAGGRRDLMQFDLSVHGSGEVQCSITPHWGTSANYRDIITEGADVETVIDETENVAEVMRISAGWGRMSDTAEAAEDTTVAETDAVIEPITEAATEPETDPATDELTEAVTEAATEEVTDAVIEPVTEPATEPVTEAVTEPVTDAVTTDAATTEEVTTDNVTTDAATTDAATTDAVTTDAVTTDAVTTDAVTTDAVPAEPPVDLGVAVIGATPDLKFAEGEDFYIIDGELLVIKIGEDPKKPEEEKKEPTKYMVKEGDILELIADKFGTTVERIVAYNGIADMNLIYPGTELEIPPADWVMPAVTTAPETTTVPAETTTVPAETTTVPAETTTVPAETTAVPAETTTVPAETTTVPAETTTVPAETTTEPAETTTEPVDTTTEPEETTTATEETTGLPVEEPEPEETTVPEPTETTGLPEEEPEPEEEKTEETTGLPEETTAPETTEAVTTEAETTEAETTEAETTEAETTEAETTEAETTEAETTEAETEETIG